MTYYYTYKVTCLQGSFAGKYYFGQHHTDDLDDGYCGSGTLVNNYYKKYGKEENVTYTKEILNFYSNMTELNEAEFKLIGDKYNSDTMCLNLIAGGRQPGNSEETSLRKSEAQKKRYEDPEERRKQSERYIGEGNPFYNKTHNEDAKERMSMSDKKRYEDPEERRKQSERLKGNQNAKGHKCSKESKNIMSEKHKGISPPNKGIKGILKWYNNGFVESQYIEGQQPEGYVLGRITTPCKNKKCYNNGVENHYYAEGQQPEGYVLGKIKKSK